MRPHSDPDRSAERLPVSLLTGFLGSGKTTLLNRLVQRPELADSLVIINEFGEIALDHLLVAPVEGETVVLASGCLCCAVRGDLQDTLRRLLVERERGEVPQFRRVLIETRVSPIPLRSRRCFCTTRCWAPICGSTRSSRRSTPRPEPAR